jgi:hypothetical protein
MSNRLAKYAGLHGGGYLLLALAPFWLAWWVAKLSILIFGCWAIWCIYQMGSGWLW